MAFDTDLLITVLLDCFTDCFEDVSVLDNVVEVLVTGDNACGSAVVRPQTILVRYIRPFIVVGVVSEYLVSSNSW